MREIRLRLGDEVGVEVSGERVWYGRMFDVNGAETEFGSCWVSALVTGFEREEEVRWWRTCWCDEKEVEEGSGPRLSTHWSSIHSSSGKTGLLFRKEEPYEMKRGRGRGVHWKELEHVCAEVANG